jgi:hypothetical protein
MDAMRSLVFMNRLGITVDLQGTKSPASLVDGDLYVDAILKEEVAQVSLIMSRCALPHLTLLSEPVLLVRAALRDRLVGPLFDNPVELSDALLARLRGLRVAVDYVPDDELYQRWLGHVRQEVLFQRYDPSFDPSFDTPLEALIGLNLIGHQDVDWISTSHRSLASVNALLAPYVDPDVIGYTRASAPIGEIYLAKIRIGFTELGSAIVRWRAATDQEIEAMNLAKKKAKQKG